jgi:hypothetical protein
MSVLFGIVGGSVSSCRRMKIQTEIREIHSGTKDKEIQQMRERERERERERDIGYYWGRVELRAKIHLHLDRSHF